MHPLPADFHISSDDSQLALLMDKDKGTEASEGNTGAYSSDQPMTSPNPGSYQKLSSSSPLPDSSPIQVQKALSERSCMVSLDIYP